jgi:hypothetical protein
MDMKIRTDDGTDARQVMRFSVAWLIFGGASIALLATGVPDTMPEIQLLSAVAMFLGFTVCIICGAIALAMVLGGFRFTIIRGSQ